MKKPVRRSPDRVLATILALAVPSIAFAADGTICVPVVPGESLQLKLLIPAPVPNDPTPIIVDAVGLDLDAVAGVALVGAPDAAGTAVINGTSLVMRTVSPTTAVVSSDPMIAVTIAVPDQAAAGTTATVTLGGAASSALDPLGSSCTADPSAQVTSTGTWEVSITDVLPGGGFLPAGSLVAVTGVGFQPGAEVLIDGVSLASTSWLDSTRIEVVTAVDTQLDGRVVSVTNPDLTGATYVSFLRATELGKSARALLAATEAIFPVRTLSSASFAMPTTGTFFGLALQNPDPAESIVSVELLDAGSLVASASIVLPPRTKISREISELFPGVIPSADSAFAVTATVPVQMLGLSGDETNGSVVAVLPAPASP